MGLEFHAPSVERLGSGGKHITFDPLAVATVLPNPRAVASAVRLYTQDHPKEYRWPYLTMLGGTLPPLGALVDHIVYPHNSITPALSLALKTTRQLPVKSLTEFPELPLDFRNNWLSTACDFQSSKAADNDFMIVSIDKQPDNPSRGSLTREWAIKIFFTSVNLVNGMILFLLLVIGIFLGDPWAMCLFFIYILHWMVSTLISTTTTLVGPTLTPPRIREDESVRFALYERKAPEGGTVVFKGRQDSLEAWARGTGQFYGHSAWNQALHWAWMLTGSFAALASTAAMVNMIASLQLAFLGVLLYGSIFDLVLIRISQRMDKTSYEHSYTLIGDNKFRTAAVIRATLEPEPHLRLTGLDWVQMGALPKRLPIFVDMQEMLADLGQLQEPSSSEHTDAVAAIIQSFQDKYPGNGLATRIAKETTDVLASIAAKSSDTTLKNPENGTKQV